MLADPARFAGVIGSFAARLRVAEGFEVAIAAALGAAAEAVAVAGLDAAADILAALRAADAGSAALVADPWRRPAPIRRSAASAPPSQAPPSGTADLPSATDLVRGTRRAGGGRGRASPDVVVVADLGRHAASFGKILTSGP